MKDCIKQPVLRQSQKERSTGDRLLTVNDAASMLAMKPSTLYQWAYERHVPTVKIGRALRFRLSDIENLIAKCVRPALLPLADKAA